MTRDPDGTLTTYTNWEQFEPDWPLEDDDIDDDLECDQDHVQKYGLTRLA